MATGGDTELAPLLQSTDLNDTDLISVANMDTVDTRLSHFPNFYVIEFNPRLRDPGIGKSVTFSSVVVKLSDAEAKRKLLSLQFVVTKLKLDEGRQVIIAEHTGRPMSKEFAAKWTKDVVSEISRKGPGVNRYAITDLKISPAAILQTIKNEFPSVSCELNQAKSMLLLYSQISVEVKKAQKREDLANEFVTPARIKVSLFKEDITTAPTEGVVSAVDGQISFSGGVSQAILKVVGPQMKKECDSFLKSKKELAVTEVLATTGQPKWKKVLHARGPCWGDSPEDDCRKQLTQTVYNCFQQASELGLTSLAVPFVSSRTFQVPQDVCAESYKTAIDMFDKDAAKKSTTLKKIIFVDESDERVSHVQRFMSLNMQSSNTLRIVLVGKAGVGKSSTGNNILGKALFKAQQAWSAVTTECKLGTVERLGIDIEVVDSPGLFDEYDAEHEQRLMKELLRTIVLCLPGPHVFFLIFSGDDRFNKSEVDICKTLKALFSDPDDQNNFMRFVIVVFTKVKSKTRLEELRKTATPYLHALLLDCNERYFGINNPKKFDTPPKDKPTTVDTHLTNIEQLIQAAVDLRERNGGQRAFFTSSLLKRCAQLIQSEEYKDKSLDEIKREIGGGKDDKLIEKLANDKKASSGILNALKNLWKKQ